MSIYSRYFPIRAALVLVCAISLAATLNALPCDPWLGPIMNISTANSFMEISGATIRFYGRNETDIDRSTYIQYSTREILEIDNYPVPSCVDGHIYLLPPAAQAFVKVLKTFSWSEFDCEPYVVTETLFTGRTSSSSGSTGGSNTAGAPGEQVVNITSVVYNVTFLNQTLAPDFFMQLNYSVTTSAYTIDLGSSPLSRGENYIVTYEYVPA